MSERICWVSCTFKAEKHPGSTYCLSIIHVIVCCASLPRWSFRFCCILDRFYACSLPKHTPPKLHPSYKHTSASLSARNMFADATIGDSYPENREAIPFLYCSECQNKMEKLCIYLTWDLMWHITFVHCLHFTKIFNLCNILCFYQFQNAISSAVHI